MGLLSGLYTPLTPTPVRALVIEAEILRHRNGDLVNSRYDVLRPGRALQTGSLGPIMSYVGY